MIRNSLILAALVGILAACSADITAPTPAPGGLTDAARYATAPSARVLEASALAPSAPAADKKLLTGLKWIAPLKIAESYTVTVTPARGGEIKVSKLGARVTIPAGAVNAPMKITMTILPGSVPAFDFEPAGTRFNVPLVFQQDLKYTGWDFGQELNIAYFALASDVDGENGTVNSSEIIPVTLVGKLATFSIWHFSGYAAAGGRRPTQ